MCRLSLMEAALTVPEPMSVSFDLTDAFEVKLLNHAEDEQHGNFSEFVKRLIARDLEGRNVSYPLETQLEIEEDDDKDAMGGFF